MGTWHQISADAVGAGGHWPCSLMSSRAKLAQCGPFSAWSVLFAVAGAHADAPRNAGSNYFDEADRILANNRSADVTSLAERGWAVVRAAGPSHPGFLDGVYAAARIFRVLGHHLRVESVYAEAIKASEAPLLPKSGCD